MVWWGKKESDKGGENLVILGGEKREKQRKRKRSGLETYQSEVVHERDGEFDECTGR